MHIVHGYTLVGFQDSVDRFVHPQSSRHTDARKPCTAGRESILNDPTPPVKDSEAVHFP